VRVLSEISDGALWAGTTTGCAPLRRAASSAWMAPAPSPRWRSTPSARDRAGDLWVGGWRLMRIHGGAGTFYPMGPEASQNQVKSILQTNDGDLWVGTVAASKPHAADEDRFRLFSPNHQHGARSAPDARRSPVDRHHRPGRLYLQGRQADPDHRTHRTAKQHGTQFL